MNTLFKLTGKSAYGLPLFTWSEDFANKLCIVSDELSSIETDLININPNENYSFTYAPLGNSIISKRLFETINEIIYLLINLNPKNGIMLFENMLFDRFSPNALHALFSLLSARLNTEKRQANSVSLHSPLKQEESDNGFPVHADLFKAKAILNIIARTDNFEGGDILLIPFEEFSDAMYTTQSMPTSVKDYIKEVFQSRVMHDTFDSIFNLMYGDFPWVEELKASITSRQLCIPGVYGMGYFLIDGEWLHGRTKIHGSVLKSRIQRLIFDTEHTLSLSSVSETYEEKNKWIRVSSQNDLLYKSQKTLPNKAIQQI